MFIFEVLIRINMETENSSEKKIKEKLFSKNSESVISALNRLKETGRITHLPLLFDLLNSTPEPQIEKEILFILNNLKIKEAVVKIIEAIENPEYLSIRKKIISCCWQNGLDFKNHLPLFADLMIEGDWETAFEAFTVIENMENMPEQKIIDVAAGKIREALKSADDQKKYFLTESLSLIS